MTKFNRKLLVAMSDPHSGFTLGLTNPETELYDEEGEIRYPEMNAGNNYLWNEVFTWALDEINKFAGDDEIIFFTLGDQTHGNKYIRQQKSTEIADEVFIAASNLEYVIKKLPNIIAMFNIIGTNT